MISGVWRQSGTALRQQDFTFGAETSGDVRLGRGDVGQTQSALIKVLIGEEVSQADVGGFLCNVDTELLQICRGCLYSVLNIHVKAKRWEVFLIRYHIWIDKYTSKPCGREFSCFFIMCSPFALKQPFMTSGVIVVRVTRHANRVRRKNTEFTCERNINKGYLIFKVWCIIAGIVYLLNCTALIHHTLWWEWGHEFLNTNHINQWYTRLILHNDLSSEDLMYVCLLLLKAPVYIKEYTRLYFTGSKTLQSKVSV